MKKKVKWVNGVRSPLWLMFLCFCVFLSGCSNYRELNQISFVLGIGIDYLPDQDEYVITLQVVNPSENAAKSTGSGTTPVINYQTRGKTLSDAALNTAKVFSRQNIFSHIELIIIGEELAKKESLNFIFDIFERSAEVRVNVPVLIARGTNVKTIMDTLSSIDKIPVRTLVAKIENSTKLIGEYGETKIYEIIEDLTNAGSEPAISGISIVGDKKRGASKDNLESMDKTYTQLNGLAIFRKGKLVGWLDGKKTKSIQIIRDKAKFTHTEIPCTDGHYITIAETRLHTHTDVDLNNHQAEITIQTDAYGSINELLCNTDIDKHDVLQEYEQKSARELEKEIKDGIIAAQELKSDVFGFGEILRISHLKEWNEHKDDWNELFSRAKVNVHVNMDIQGTGMRIKPYPY